MYSDILSLGFCFRLPDQHIVEAEPKKSKLSKPRFTTGATVSKTVTKQPKGNQKSYDDYTSRSSSSTDVSATTTKKDHFSVEKVMVEEAVPFGSSGQLFGSGQDPFAMVETIQYSMARPLSLPVSDGHLNHEASSSPLSSVGSLASYEDIQARLSFIGDENVKTKSHSKKGKSSKLLSSKKEKGLHGHKAKLPGAKDKFGVALLGKSGKISTKASTIASDSAGSTKSPTKWTMKTPVHYSKGESSKQSIGHGEASRRTWPTIPNLDYASGRRSCVTFNNETVFITQYKLLQ